MPRNIVWPEPGELAPLYKLSRAILYDRATEKMPQVGGHKVISGTDFHPTVRVSYSGWWVYMVPPELWGTVPNRAVKRLISHLWKMGYGSVPTIAQTSNVDLLSTHGVGEQSLGMLRQWLRGVGL